MLNKIKKEDVRYTKMYIDAFGVKYSHRTNPWAIAWWSAALPGFGHLTLGSYLKGFLFMFGEILLNLKARINLSIYYTFIGNFDKANDVFNERWGLFYIAVWIFAIYDSYLLSIEQNKICELEEAQEYRYFQKMHNSLFGMTFLNQREPFFTVFLSTILGGMGHVYIGQIIKGFILLGWSIAINYYSQTGHLVQKFVLGKEIYLQNVNWEWLLFLPSIWGFCIWDSYVHTIETNKLIIEEQRYTYGKKKGRKSLDNLPSSTTQENKDNSFTFLVGKSKQSISLELIINSFKIHGIDKHEIIFLDRLTNKKRETGDSIRKSDGISNFNGAICGATVLMLFGTMWGGALIPGGPIAIGLAGFLLGALIGYLIDAYLVGWIRAKLNWDPIKGSNPVEGEVLIIARVNSREQHDYVTKIFMEKNVPYVGVVNKEELQSLLT
ncbi:hypothetical protein SAMN00017405_1695 [Desulfonispora thiosulfatigenes DSM 11270]|uniref:Uncharacterized protein n=1 Tax=Desulfonispora thiosulfatigenes DSM 11270 TaxID=656914 RepID=A0A1W1V2C2_DESTI|nr:hypothetical protein [Desulfonispora thiosulfatigenes]SMB87436.1 hypothetical protein SAMN00017405_1695 [Desulfonispora thiosulfatigenes DSM 11270]